MSPEDVRPEWVEKARAAIVAKADADDALDDAGKMSDDEWDRALSTTHSTNGVARRVDGDPEVFARTVLAAVMPEAMSEALAKYLDAYVEAQPRMGDSNAAFAVLREMAAEVNRLREGSES
jgi:hypothetical protein